MQTGVAKEVQEGSEGVKGGRGTGLLSSEGQAAASGGREAVAQRVGQWSEADEEVLRRRGGGRVVSTPGAASSGGGEAVSRLGPEDWEVEQEREAMIETWGRGVAFEEPPEEDLGVHTGATACGGTVGGKAEGAGTGSTRKRKAEVTVVPSASVTGGVAPHENRRLNFAETSGSVRRRRFRFD